MSSQLLYRRSVYNWETGGLVLRKNESRTSATTPQTFSAHLTPTMQQFIQKLHKEPCTFTREHLEWRYKSHSKHKLLTDRSRLFRLGAIDCTEDWQPNRMHVDVSLDVTYWHNRTWYDMISRNFTCVHKPTAWHYALYENSTGIHCLIICAIQLLTPNNLGGTWRSICSPDIRNVSALEVLRNRGLRPRNRHLLTYLLTQLSLYKDMKTDKWTVKMYVSIVITPTHDLDLHLWPLTLKTFSATPTYTRWISVSNLIEI